MTAQLLPNVIQYFYDSSGLPLAGGKLYSYAAGTTTPLATYTDESAGTPNTNPIVLNAAGQASVWLSSSAYKFKLTDSLNNVQWTVDNVSYINPGSIDLTKIGGSIAGLALKQNNSGSLDVQVDQVTLQVNTTGMNNYLQVKPGGLTSAAFNSSNLLEVLVKNVRDYSCPGLMQQIPQYEWANPTLLSTPSLNPGGAASVAKWSPNGEFLAVGAVVSPFITIYQISEGVFTALANPVTIPTDQVYDLSWSPCGDYLAVSYKGTPTIIIYQRFGNAFIALPTPASVPTGSNKKGLNISFSPNSDFLILGWSGSAGSAGIILYERSVSSTVSGTYSGTSSVTTNAQSLGVGGPPDYTVQTTISTGFITGSGSSAGTIATVPLTTFTDITTISTLTGITGPFAWSPDSSLLGALDTATGRIDVFFRTNYVFAGITPPVVSSYLGHIVDFKFSNDGNFLAVSLNITPFVLLFKITSATFSQLSNPAALPLGVASCVVWSDNSEFLLVGDSSATTPFLTIYQVTNPISSPTFTKISDPASAPAGSLTSASWSPTKQFLAVAGATTPFVQTYKTISTLPSNALLWVRGIPNV